MVAHAVFPLIAGDSRLDMTLYEHGPGPPFKSPAFLGAVFQEPRKEYEGESSPKQDVRPVVEDLLGFVN